MFGNSYDKNTNCEVSVFFNFFIHLFNVIHVRGMLNLSLLSSSRTSVWPSFNSPSSLITVKFTMKFGSINTFWIQKLNPDKTS